MRLILKMLSGHWYYAKQYRFRYCPALGHDAYERGLR